MNNRFKHSQTMLMLLAGIIISIFQITNVQAENRMNASLLATGIVGGRTVSSSEFPWMVALLRPGNGSVIDRKICGGTLIAPQWVLTAAHCVIDGDIEILLGRHNLEDSQGEIISVIRVVIHPEYESEINNNDLALLKMAKTSSIQPVLRGENFDFQAERGGLATALGWGIIDQDFFYDYYTPTLQQVDLSINSNDTCENRSLPDNVICLGVFDKKTVCKGDSGGPLLIFNINTQSWEQIGITSFGLGTECARDENIAVYTQVDKFKDFINSTINSPTISAEEFLAKCINKYPAYVGQKQNAAFPCGVNHSEICQNTTSGSLTNIIQLAVLSNQSDQMVQYFDQDTGIWNKISYSALAYCE